MENILCDFWQFCKDDIDTHERLFQKAIGADEDHITCEQDDGHILRPDLRHVEYTAEEDLTDNHRENA